MDSVYSKNCTHKIRPSDKDYKENKFNDGCIQLHIINVTIMVKCLTYAVYNLPLFPKFDSNCLLSNSFVFLLDP